MDTELFFPVGESAQVSEQIRMAKRVCSACPVQDLCLEFAIRTIQNDGIWGGATEDERKVIKRARRAAARRTAVAARADADAHGDAAGVPVHRQDGATRWERTG